MNEQQLRGIAEKFSGRFLKELHGESRAEWNCEWNCSLWLTERYASEAKKSQIRLQQAKEHLGEASSSSASLRSLFMEAQFRNTAAQVYSRIFDGSGRTCDVKVFSKCPYLEQRNELMRLGTLANAFMTLLQKATHFSMLERHPEDSGLINDEYEEVYGINLTNFKDLQDSLMDGRFDKLYQAVAKRAAGLAGFHSNPTISS